MSCCNSRVVLVGVCVAGLAGCGSGVGTSLNEAYSACYNVGATTQEIDLLVRTLRIYRDDGTLTAADVLAGVAMECTNVACVDCLTALVDAVY